MLKVTRTTGVEIDPVIISLAGKYFGLADLANNRVLQADAWDVALKPHVFKLDPLFDCVVIDTYSGADFPEKLSSEEFYLGVNALLSDGGLVVVNRIISKSDRTSENQIKDRLSRYFREVKVRKVKSPVSSDNYLFCGSKSRRFDTIG